MFAALCMCACFNAQVSFIYCVAHVFLLRVYTLVCVCVQAPFCVPVRKSPLVFVCVVSVAGTSFVSSYGGVKCGCLCRRPSENAVCVSACVCVCVSVFG